MIETVCCQHPYQALQATSSQLLHEAETVHGSPTPDGLSTFRNLFVKTQLRLLLSGPFLFLDSDTVVRKPLTPLLNLQADIAAAPNHSADTSPSRSGPRTRPNSTPWAGRCASPTPTAA